MLLKIKANHHLLFKHFTNWDDAIKYIFREMTPEYEQYIGRLTDSYIGHGALGDGMPNIGDVSVSLIKASVNTGTINNYGFTSFVYAN